MTRGIGPEGAGEKLSRLTHQPTAEEKAKEAAAEEAKQQRRIQSSLHGVPKPTSDSDTAASDSSIQRQAEWSRGGRP